MEKILTILLVALMGACENSDTNTPNDDTDSTPDLYEAAFSATLNQYGWEGDSVVLLGSADKAANFIATSDGGETVSGTTPDVIVLSSGIWSSSYFYDESTMLYLGWASANLEDTTDLSATLCADLSGDWECDDGMHPDPFEVHDVVMNGCTAEFADVAPNPYPFEVDGNSVHSEGPDGSTINGIVMNDTIELVFYRAMNDQTFYGTCTRI